MASSDGNSARNMLKEILGRIGDLSAAIDQQGSSLRRGTAPLTATSVENEARNVFGAGHQAPSLTANASSPAVNAFQNGPLYTMRRNFLNFRTANYRPSREEKERLRHLQVPSHATRYSFQVPKTKTFHAKATEFSFKKVDMSLWHSHLRKSGVIWK